MQKEYKLSVTTEEILEGVNQVVKDFYFKEAVLKPGVCDLIRAVKEKSGQINYCDSNGCRDGKRQPLYVMVYGKILTG